MARRMDPQTEALIQRAAQRAGIDPGTLRTFVLIESGGNPNLVNKYGYSGLLQLSRGEFSRLGGQGNILDPEANLATGALKLRQEANDFKSRFGREPTASELYLMHQQGVGGSAKHWANPDRPAWQNMLDTGEGRQKGENWARRAIWDNVPDDVKRQYGNVDNLTSRDFVKLWDQKVARFSGQPIPASDTPQADPFSGKPVQIAQDGMTEIPADGFDPMKGFARPGEVLGTQPTAAPTMIARAPTPSTPESPFGGPLDDNSVLHWANAFWEKDAQDKNKAEAEGRRQQNTAESLASPQQMGASPMINGPRLPRIDMRSILAVLKERGVDPDNSGGLGTGGGILGTRRA